MFALRGLAVSLSVFVLIYIGLSVGVGLLWRGLWRQSDLHSEKRRANLLFALRLAPFTIAAGVIAVLAVPSFLLLEPRTANEPMSAVPVLLGCCGAALLLAGIWRAGSALLRVRRIIKGWSGEATPLGQIEPTDSIALHRTSCAAPPLIAAGILRPSVWLTQAAELVLTRQELQCALRHEVAHVRRRDNLKKMTLQFLAFPGMAELENAWRQSAEMAADDAAVSSAAEALDLAAAVIKLSRLAPLEPPAELTTALVHSPAECLNARVERLLDWTDRRQSPTNRFSLALGLCGAMALTGTLALTYSAVLTRVHIATEWLVR